jgi:ankyrin repeat protein
LNGSEFDINSVDPLGRSALIIAIENENLQLIELLLSYKINPNDALLHAINEEFVEGIKS